MHFVVRLYPRVCSGLMPEGKVKLFIFDEYLHMSQYLKIQNCCIILLLHLLASQLPAELVSCEHFLI